MPRSACLEKSRSAICRPVSASRLPVGSSAISRAGCGRQRAGNRDALLLAAGKLAGIMAQPLAEADRLQLARGDLESIAVAGEFQRHGDVFQRRHVGDQVEGLEDDADIAAAKIGERSSLRLWSGVSRMSDLAAVEPFEAGQHHQQCRLAGTGRADDADGFAFARS